jgi:hypothetical protein
VAYCYFSEMKQVPILPTSLDVQQTQPYVKDIIYRLNCLMSWDLFKYIQEKYKNERSVYKTGQIVEPAFEVSAIFGRQLLGFLKIKKKYGKNELIELTASNNSDDLTIDSLYASEIGIFHLHELTEENKSDLINLIKVADKAIAHFTKNHTKDEEFTSLENARLVIYNLILKYVPDIKNDPDYDYKKNIRWENRESYTDAIIQ